MSEFQELIKNFNKCRDYVRDFFVYGFKSRQDFTSDRKSARTYDNERRRIESWLGDYVEEALSEQDTKSRVKSISLQLDSNLLNTNPLFSVWKTKSFTNNDILLHFYLLDILRKQSYSASELAEILSQDYEMAVDTQLVRRKCNEYVKEGILATTKSGKSLLYSLGLTWEELCENTADHTDTGDKSLREPLSDVISFMQLSAPFGYVGNTILDKISHKNESFRVKHGFPAFTLEEEITYALLLAKKNHRYVKMEIQSSRRPNDSLTLCGIPLRIFVSARTGRRYICIYRITNNSFNTNKIKYHFRCVRLDQIKSVKELTSRDRSKQEWEQIETATSSFSEMEEKLARNLPYIWGVSFSGSRTKVVLTLNIQEQSEQFILTRLAREGKGGTMTKLRENTFLFETIVQDAQEMFPWLRTFIGRIVDLRFYQLDSSQNPGTENHLLRRHFFDDINALYQIYETNE